MSRYTLLITLWFLGAAQLVAQVSPSNPNPSTNAPAAVPPPQSVAISDVVTQSDSVLARLKTDQDGLSNDTIVQAAETALPNLVSKIDSRVSADKELLESDPTLADLQNSQSAWRAVATELAAVKASLSSRASQIDSLIAQLGTQSATWQATLTSAKSGNVPAEALDRIRSVSTEIAASTKMGQSAQSNIISLQSRVSEQDSRISQGIAGLAKAQESAQQALFRQDQLPLWSESFASLAMGHEAEENNSLQNQILSVRTYLVEKIAVVGVHLLVVVLLTINLFAMRKTLHDQAQADPALKKAESIFAYPIATAVLLSLLVSGWLYPLPPRLLWSTIGIIGLMPTVMILRRITEPALLPILYAIVSAYFIDQLRHILIPAGVYARLLFITELLAGCLFIIWLFRSKRLNSHFVGPRYEHWIRICLHAVLWLSVLAGIANLLGYVKLSDLVGNGTLRSCYLTVVVYAAVQIIDALVLSALSIPPLSRFRVVEKNRGLVYGKTFVIITWIALALWFIGVLQVFTVRQPAWQAAHRLMGHTFHWGSIVFSLGDVLAFVITVWASFLISRFLRFILEEEVYPHLSLGRGIPYAASTMVHYTVLVAGFFAALGALGIDLSKFSILAGAFGVGLGFGLQNIMNNFVSGIILLFERPIKVGDTLQMDTSTGVVESIGIRASIIRLSNGSSAIIPNGNLISNPVTNWSLTNNRRMIEIPVSVNSKVDSNHIIELLLKIAGENKQVVKFPAPQAQLATFTGAALVFRVRVWVNADTDWSQVTSDVSLAINSAFANEGIAIS